MQSLKQHYIEILKDRKSILSYLKRVNILMSLQRQKVCSCDCDCSYHCDESRCNFGNPKIEQIIDLRDRIESNLHWIQAEINICKTKLSKRYEIKRIVKLNKKARKNNPLGSWIHIFNRSVSNWTEYINNFSKIQGEVCVSKETDYQFAYRSQFIGVKIEGKLTAQWNFDCWSKIIANGKRWGTKNGGNHRNEGWLVPADCKITAIVCAKPNKQITRIARELNLNIEILDQNRRNDW